MTSWKKVRDGYEEHGLALFLGAGVSCGSGIPNWPQLVCRVAERIGGQEKVEALRAEGFSLPAITEWVRAEFLKSNRSPKDFIEAVRTGLYQKFPFKDVPTMSEPGSAQKFREHVEVENKTLSAVYDLAVLDSEDQLRPNPKIAMIVNTNIDSLLESYDTARNALHGGRGQKRCLHTIENAAASRIVGRTSVFHPHGYLRFDRGATRVGKESDSIVLAESEYYDFYAKPTEIFTYTMLHLLREHCCVFIGLSMTDENLRRLLHYSEKEMREARLRTNMGKKRARHVAIFGADAAKDVMRDFVDKTLPPLGVEPLWVESFEEIHKGFRAIAQEAGPKTG